MYGLGKACEGSNILSSLRPEKLHSVMGGNTYIDWDIIWTRGVDYGPPFHQNHFLVFEVQDMVARMTKEEQLFFLNIW